MGFYDEQSNIDFYLDMAEGYDGRELIEILKGYLPKGSSVLEIGMGPGVDLDILKEHYSVTGSDTSQLFLNRYKSAHPQADLLMLDAVSLETDRRFDAVFSNKVLHHLGYDRITQSFIRQAEVLNPRGIVMHSFWYGSEIEEHQGLMFYQLTEEKLKSLIPEGYEILKLEKYTEMEEGDSLYGIFQLKG